MEEEFYLREKGLLYQCCVASLSAFLCLLGWHCLSISVTEALSHHIGVAGVSCVSANWEATLPTPGGDACHIPPPWGLSASMVVYRCQKAPVGRLTREKDVFFLGADFDVPGAKIVTAVSLLNGSIYRAEKQANGLKLTKGEEESLVQWILSMDQHGAPL